MRLKSKLHISNYIILSIFFILVVWGPPYPFYLATSDVLRRSASAIFNSGLNTKAIIQISIWLGFFVFLFMMIMRRGVACSLAISKKNRILKLWAIFVIFCLVSQLFTYSFLLSGLRVFQLITLLLFLIFMLNNDVNYKQLPLNLLCIFVLVNLFYNLLLYVIYPSSVVSTSYIGFDRLIGGWIFKRDYGMAALFVFAYSVSTLCFMRFKWRYILLLIVSLLGLYLGGTRAFIIAAFILLLLAISTRARSGYARVALSFVSCLCLSLVVILFKTINEAMGRSSESLASGSGRFEAWGLFLSDFFENSNLAFGNGFLAAGRVIATKYYDSGFGNMHNMYLEVFVDLGFLGFLCFVLIIYCTLKCWFSHLYLLRRKNINRKLKRDYFCLGLVFVSLLIVGVTSNSFMEDFLLGTYVYITSSVYIYSKSRELRGFF